MKKLLGILVLSGATLFAVSGTSDTLAQGKKGAKSGTVELIESKDGKFRFTVRDGEGKYVGGSAVGHATEKDAKAAVEDLKAALASPTYVSKKAEAKKEEKKKEVNKDS